MENKPTLRERARLLLLEYDPDYLDEASDSDVELFISAILNLIKEELEGLKVMRDDEIVKLTIARGLDASTYQASSYALKVAQAQLSHTINQLKE